MAKKICPSVSDPCSDIVLEYTYPVYHDKGKKKYVDLKVFDPALGIMRRKKYHLDHIVKKSERNKMANLMISRLVSKLSQGWNPWVDVNSYRGYTKLDDVFDKYLEFVNQSSRKKTIHSYTSRVNVFRQFVKSLNIDVVYVYQYTSQLVIDFLDWLSLDRQVGPRTRNNYRGWCNSFGEFLVSRKYLESNPCSDISKVAEKPKKRLALTGDMLRQLYSYLERTDKFYLLAVMMQYYTFIRPSELCNLKIQDFRLKDQTVFVSADISKNKRNGTVGLNESIIRLMLDLNIFSHPGNLYLFSKNFMPGNDKMGPDIFNKRWHTVRAALKWSDRYQFYSLKDSGIRDLANEAGIVVARDQARHTDVATTNKYLGLKEDVWDETKRFAGNLSNRDDKTLP